MTTDTTETSRSYWKIGDTVHFAYERDDAPNRLITAIAENGMIELEGLSGLFAPQLFVRSPLPRIGPPTHTVDGKSFPDRQSFLTRPQSEEDYPLNMPKRVTYLFAIPTREAADALLKALEAAEQWITILCDEADIDPDETFVQVNSVDKTTGDRHELAKKCLADHIADARAEIALAKGEKG